MLVLSPARLLRSTDWTVWPIDHKQMSPPGVRHYRALMSAHQCAHWKCYGAGYQHLARYVLLGGALTQHTNIARLRESFVRSGNGYPSVSESKDGVGRHLALSC